MSWRYPLLAICEWFCIALVAAEKPYTQWREYGGSIDSMQFSALTQVNKSNVTQLKPAWFYSVPGEPAHLPFNPLVIDKVMYVAGVRGWVTALDAATGKELWVSTNNTAPDRGLAYWENKDRSDRRLITTSQNGLKALDARNGQIITGFGNGGFVDMRIGSDRPLAGPNRTPSRIFENFLIVGSNTGEGYGSPPGDIRAFDVVTGKLIWTFHTVPRPGEFGHDTYKNTNAWKYVGGANVWGEITIDPKNAIAFFPTGSPTYDLYGADRIGNNLFGNCLIALDVRTGKRLWHFQIIHHDLWDYDLGAAPKLLTIQREGKPIEIVAEAGKTGFLYVFERLTGKPIWPIEEKPFPKSDLPGEVSSPTQPIPSKPPPFSRQQFTAADINPHLPATEQEEIRVLIRGAANDGIFTPPTNKRYQIQIPGTWGGANWGSAAVNPDKGLLYIRTIDFPSLRKMSIVGQGAGALPQGATNPQNPGYATYLQLCAGCHGLGQVSMKSPSHLGAQNFRSLLRQGRNEMPPFPEEVLPPHGINDLEKFLLSLPLAAKTLEGAANDAPLRLPLSPTRYTGPPIRYAGTFSAFWHATNGLPPISPPWSQLTAYDLNTGEIKWRVADGHSPALAAKGIKNTGNVRPRNGPVVTAAGLIFIANSQDGFIRAYDVDDGKILWEYELNANPEGIPAIYEMNGRQYIIFAAGTAIGTDGEPTQANPYLRKTGKIDAQGYHAFALP